MSVILTIPNEPFNRGEKTRLASAQTAVGTSLTCENTDGLAADDFIIGGREGSEKAELKQIDSVNADQKNIILTSATKFVHGQFEEITKLYYNKRRIYRKASGESSYSLIATVDIEVDRPEGTVYVDQTGASTSLYKATYYNSATSTETSQDDAKATYGSGGTHYADLSDIREEAGFTNNDNITDERLFRHRARAEAEVNGSVGTRYSLPISGNTYWSDSEAQELIRQITILLAAGWVLWQEYPDERNAGTEQDGMKKIKEGRSMLKSIREGMLTLLGTDNEPLTQRNTHSIEGYPDSSFTTIPDENHDDDENFVFQFGKSW